MTPPRPAAACLLAAGLAAALLAAPDAQAQSNPSADQIINSLRPGGGMMGGTRGIRPVSPDAARPAAEAPRPVARPLARAAARAAPPGAVPGAAAPAAAASQPAAPSVNLSVQFASNSAELTPAAVRTLTELGRALASSTLSTYRFRIEGHTDTAGPPEANKALSERRAQAVAAFLSARGIDSSRLEAVGMGQDGLLVQTPPGTAEPRNRRVQVINLGA